MGKISSIIQSMQDLLELHVWHRIDHIRIIDIIDMILLAIICYKIINFILQRRAVNVAWGLIIVVLSAMVTTLFDMKALMLIFNNIMQVGIIAFVIVFQPELRAVLQKIGNVSIPNIKHINAKHINAENKYREYIESSITEITETACDLSMEKTGALIVIERDMNLGEHIKTGTVLNAQMTTQLLKNIFFNKAPLHDGAVIVRNYRIYAAGCFLPLSFNQDIDESLGTRHRAAIGISEVSDAVVVVVSEETGRISIVQNGVIKQNYSYSTLRKELTKILMPKETPKTNKRTKSKKSNKNKQEETV